MTAVRTWKVFVHSESTLFTAIPVVFSTAVYNINQIIDLTIFNHVMEAQGYVEKEYMALQGIYTGKYDTLINVPMQSPMHWVLLLCQV